MAASVNKLWNRYSERKINSNATNELSITNPFSLKRRPRQLLDSYAFWSVAFTRRQQLFYIK